MTDTPIDEQIKVWVFFDHSSNLQPRLFPIAMSWQRRMVKFEKLVFTSTKRVGDNRIVSLVCSAGDTNYELEYNSGNYGWRLKKVMASD